MWRVLKADGAARVAENPWEGIQKRREVPSRRREMTLEEVSRAFAVLKGEMRLLFLVGIYTGQRLGDCALLEWGSVDLARRRITLTPRKTRKTGRTVVIPIHDNLFSALLSIPPERRRGYVMPECAGEYTANRLGAAFKAAFKAAGIATDAEGERGTRRRAVVSFHSLRHTFVSIAANAGIPLAVVQSIVGHSTPGMTRHYFHQSESALVSAVASLPCVGTAEGCGVSARLRSAIAAADALTADERRELVRHLTGGRAAIPPSGAGSAA